MRRRRHQKGSLQLRKRGGVKTWHVLYYDGAIRRTHTFDPQPKNKTEAETARAEFMLRINGAEGKPRTPRSATLAEFITEAFLPHMRPQWKPSTHITTENRIQKHIVEQIGSRSLREFTLTGLQGFLEARAAANLGDSMVRHLRFDLRAIFGMAHAEGLLERNPAAELNTPRDLRRGASEVMTAEMVECAMAALAQRERVIFGLAVMAGMRPGEILGLQRRHLSSNCRLIEIEQRVYRGAVDTPKTRRGVRTAGIGPDLAKILKAWRDAGPVGRQPDSWIFPGALQDRPATHKSILRDHIQAPLAKIGLEWVDFQVFRRTHASLGHAIDPKVMADQRGHGIGVAIDTYTRSSMAEKSAAAEKLERKVRAKRKTA